MSFLSAGVAAATEMQAAMGKLGEVFAAGPNEPAGEPTHICCCDPGRALCGADTTGQAIEAVHPKASGTPCRKCVELDGRGAKCGEPKCPGPGPVDA